MRVPLPGGRGGGEERDARAGRSMYGPVDLSKCIWEQSSTRTKKGPGSSLKITRCGWPVSGVHFQQVTRSLEMD